MKKILVLFFCFTKLLLYAQEKEAAAEKFIPHHSVTFLLGHSYVGQGFSEGKKKWLTLPSLTLDYNYFFSSKWSLGLHNDMITENFKIEDPATNEEVVERSKPIASAAVVSFKPGKHFLFELGAGGEFAKEGNYFLNRLGIEYALEISHQWELTANFIYDIKWNAYNSLGLGIGVSKAFGFREK